MNDFSSIIMLCWMAFYDLLGYSSRFIARGPILSLLMYIFILYIGLFGVVVRLNGRRSTLGFELKPHPNLSVGGFEVFFPPGLKYSSQGQLKITKIECTLLYLSYSENDCVGLMEKITFFSMKHLLGFFPFCLFHVAESIPFFSQSSISCWVARDAGACFRPSA